MTQLTLAEGVLSQNPKLYSYIQMENPNTPDVIKTLSKNIAEVLRIVERGDRKAFERLYADLARVYSEDARKNRSLSAVYKTYQRTAQ